jgi:hypothetical protein
MSTKNTQARQNNNMAATKGDLLTFKNDILKATSGDIALLKQDINDLTLIVGNSFTRMEKTVDERFTKLENTMNEKFECVNERFDSLDLDYVSRDEFNRLEKKMRVLEAA